MISNIATLLRSKFLTVQRTGEFILKENGRKLAWAEFGDLNAKKTILYFHGTPMCRLEPILHGVVSTKVQTHDIYAAQGVRLICLERPGFGVSTFVTKRSVSEWANDVESFVTSEESKLKNTKFYVMGFSAGGPYALAIRNLLPNRVLAAAIIASSGNIARMAPSYKIRGVLEDAFFSLPTAVQATIYGIGVQGFLTSFQMSRAILQAVLSTYGGSSTPELSAQTKVDRKNTADQAETEIRTSAQSKREVSRRLLIVESLSNSIDKLSAAITTVSESTRQGYEGIVVDTLATQANAYPWGFDVSSKTYLDSLTGTELPLPPVLLYYSKEDMTVPPVMGEWLSNQIHGNNNTNDNTERSSNSNRNSSSNESHNDRKATKISGSSRSRNSSSVKSKSKGSTVTSNDTAEGSLQWLSGGHNCFFLHLEKIVTDLLHVKK
jgi:pimeloyl-ACP methyl ester carboxylesterase